MPPPMLASVVSCAAGMRIAFLGTPEFTVPLLEACAQAGELALVVAQPNRPVGRSRTLQSPPSARWARWNGVRSEQPEKVKQGRLAAVLDSARPDVAVGAAYGRHVPSHGRGVRPAAAWLYALAGRLDHLAGAGAQEPRRRAHLAVGQPASGRDREARIRRHLCGVRRVGLEAHRAATRRQEAPRRGRFPGWKSPAGRRSARHLRAPVPNLRYSLSFLEKPC